ncbi:hypothetical protein PIB30_095276 [Stylosanthes scabra]|uniref:GRF-type domain-containing protein n=1 Tax=Stylosanthes scabra TaxID=79078 RepID=A0ABU6WXF3_9FABA|nr:hypothetical protein [Stylosanthes scabra]
MDFGITLLKSCKRRSLGFEGMSYRGRSAGSGDSSTSAERVCKCGLIAHLKVSNSEANPGREYYSCPEGNCRWFKWAGPPVKTPVRVGGQHRETAADECQFGMALVCLCMSELGELRTIVQH